MNSYNLIIYDENNEIVFDGNILNAYLFVEGFEKGDMTLHQLKDGYAIEIYKGE